ncbi:hypothetical protein Pyn_26560 [Prunus yedoensis var. nudiflora]|uniref:Uncharacterized protein n=1 Tax=Prunus yedoensis var. nudiflora TaxID=2094558 RepID=A0A314ZEC1_PRUYE|nr:hypothetical protein Pyn_26560 [Prunus yedoensis var. nudiflora]
MASLLYTKSNPLASFLPKTKFLIQRRCYAAASHGPVPAGLGREGSRSSMVERAGRECYERRIWAWLFICVGPRSPNWILQALQIVWTRLTRWSSEKCY